MNTSLLPPVMFDVYWRTAAIALLLLLLYGLTSSLSILENSATMRSCPSVHAWMIWA